MNQFNFVGIADIIFIAPLLFCFLASIIPLTVKVLTHNREPNSLSSMLYAVLGPFGATIAAILVWKKSGNVPSFAFSGALVFDGLSSLAVIIVAITTFFTIVLSREHKATVGAQYSEFLFLLLNSAVGMLILAWSNDLIITFIGIEVMSLCLYLLIALSHEQKLSKEAAFKYFVLGSVASAIFLYGVAFMYGTAGTTTISKLSMVAPNIIAENKLFLVGVILAAVGFCFKVSIVPFHAWTPDVYEGAPTPVTGFMATGVKAVTFVAFMRILSGYYIDAETSGKLLTILQWLAAGTIIIGNVAAIVQSSLKRMLAYSSVAHSGYLMMGLIAASTNGDGLAGGNGVIYYIVAYTAMTLGAFAIVQVLEHKENDIVLVDELRGLAERSPFMSALFAIFLLSLAGMPPTIGFFGKLLLFSAAIKSGYLWLVIWAAIGSIISVYYYLRPIVLMYMKEESGAEVNANTRMSQAVVAIMAAIVIFGGLATQPLFDVISEAVVKFFAT